ncbi:hypothetical protein G9A89_015924 [Geosiphon pyriformis]|nr:hypothetical protein G9A89_015924 [Geosiphon pyriformis]
MDYPSTFKFSEEHFEAYNKNDLDFIELNSLTIQQTIPRLLELIAAHQSTETSLETEEESYQTVPVFDLFSNKSEHSTQTVTFEPMA